MSPMVRDRRKASERERGEGEKEERKR